MKNCSKCKKDKELKEFNKNNFNKKDGLSSWCKKCLKNNNKKHYENNKEKYNERNKIYKKEYRKWFEEYKSTLKCSRCSENHPSCLDFHHKNETEKTYEVARMVAEGWKKDLILKEIEKCIILCSNCHRKEHHIAQLGRASV